MGCGAPRRFTLFQDYGVIANEMGEPANGLAPSLFKRNAIAAVFFVLALALTRSCPQLYFLPWQAIAAMVVCGFFWANIPLYRAGKRVVAILVSIALPTLVGIPGMSIAIAFSKFESAMEYRAKGFQLVSGCNGGADNSATFELKQLDDYIERLGDAKNTNLLAQLQSVRVIAKEKAKVLNADCGKRGHREDHPWKTNWVGIKKTLAAAEKVIYEQ